MPRARGQILLIEFFLFEGNFHLGLGLGVGSIRTEREATSAAYGVGSISRCALRTVFGGNAQGPISLGV